MSILRYYHCDVKLLIAYYITRKVEVEVA